MTRIDFCVSMMFLFTSHLDYIRVQCCVVSFHLVSLHYVLNSVNYLLGRFQDSGKYRRVVAEKSGELKGITNEYLESPRKQEEIPHTVAKRSVVKY